MFVVMNSKLVVNDNHSEDHPGRVAPIVGMDPGVSPKESSWIQRQTYQTYPIEWTIEWTTSQTPSFHDEQLCFEFKGPAGWLCHRIPRGSSTIDEAGGAEADRSQVSRAHAAAGQCSELMRSFLPFTAPCNYHT